MCRAGGGKGEGHAQQRTRARVIERAAGAWPGEKKRCDFSTMSEKKLAPASHFPQPPKMDAHHHQPWAWPPSPPPDDAYDAYDDGGDLDAVLAGAARWEEEEEEVGEAPWQAPLPAPLHHHHNDP